VLVLIKDHLEVWEDCPQDWGYGFCLPNEALKGQYYVVLELDSSWVNHELEKWLHRVLDGLCITGHEGVKLAYQAKHVPALVDNDVVLLSLLMAVFELD
jgi:hypothetical protein